MLTSHHSTNEEGRELSGEPIELRGCLSGDKGTREHEGQGKQTIPRTSSFLFPFFSIDQTSPLSLIRNRSTLQPKSTISHTCIPTTPTITMADENAAPVVDEVKVDESSVKPDAVRRNSLEKHLAQRPDRAELIESESIV